MLKSSTNAGTALPSTTQSDASMANSRPWGTVAAIFTAIALSACAGLPALLPGDAAEEAALQSIQILAGSGLAGPERMQAMSARDILLEWGVFGLDPKTRKKARMASAARSSTAVADYSAAIQDIVANATCRACEQKLYHQMVMQASNLHGVPSGLIHAVILKESGYKPGARSPRNARGLMQLTPDTARFVGVRNSDRLYDPQTNINAGAAYLKYLMSTHATFDQVLAAYNAGPGNVRKYKGVPPFNETRRYVSDVKKYYALTSLGAL